MKVYFESIICHDRDKLIDYFGFKTLERAYLLRIKGKIVERIQHMWLRVAIQIHDTNLEKVKETYDLLNNKLDEVFATHLTKWLDKNLPTYLEKYFKDKNL